jgi:hypothetical protein
MPHCLLLNSWRQLAHCMSWHLLAPCLLVPRTSQLGVRICREMVVGRWAPCAISGGVSGFHGRARLVGEVQSSMRRLRCTAEHARRRGGHGRIPDAEMPGPCYSQQL